jgi:uncharacterized MAPEG superfamily protein
MPIEVSMLAWAALLLVVQFVLMAVAVNMQVGPAWTSGPRDEPRELSGMAGRLKRAFDNMLEGILLFTVAVVVVTLGDAATAQTALAAKVFVIARIAYIPAYASGIPLLRSVIWGIGFFACVFMIVQALL